jgi:hypothetical protein
VRVCAAMRVLASVATLCALLLAALALPAWSAAAIHVRVHGDDSPMAAAGAGARPPVPLQPSRSARALPTGRSVAPHQSVGRIPASAPTGPAPSTGARAAAQSTVRPVGVTSRASRYGGSSNVLTIGSFNMQVFGVTKAGKPEVLKLLAQILSRYDVAAVQEIRDASGTAFPKLLTAINELVEPDRHFESVVGPREGRTNSKEQYAFIYDTARVEPVTSYRYPDVRRCKRYGRSLRAACC